MVRSFFVGVGAVVILLSVFIGPASARVDMTDDVTRHSNIMVFGGRTAARESLAWLIKRGKKDILPALIVAMRFRHDINPEIVAAAQTMTGHKAEKWHDWMLWQQAQTDIKPHKSFVGLKRDTLARIDKRYQIFFRIGYDQPDDMRIRLEEVVWGGPPAVNGIPSLDFPRMIQAEDATYILDTDLVFGVEINGDVRAYPLRIMGWHEMFNDVIGGVPVALAYCTLCGSGILFETRLNGRSKPFIFGSSGMLYRSNKLMFDWATYSLWNQFTGEPVLGPLAKSGIRLKNRPVAITTWAKWKAKHPKTAILDLNTGHERDYSSGAVYREYFASPDLMFPATVRKTKEFRAKEYVFGVRDFGQIKAWPLKAFEKEPVINDTVGAKNIVLIGDPQSRTVRAYDRGDLSFGGTEKSGLTSADGVKWTLGEQHMIASDGRKIARIAGVLSYWYAWDGYIGVKTDYYESKK